MFNWLSQEINSGWKLIEMNDIVQILYLNRKTLKPITSKDIYNVVYLEQLSYND